MQPPSLLATIIFELHTEQKNGLIQEHSSEETFRTCGTDKVCPLQIQSGGVKNKTKQKESNSKVRLLKRTDIK